MGFASREHFGQKNTLENFRNHRRLPCAKRVPSTASHAKTTKQPFRIALFLRCERCPVSTYAKGVCAKRKRHPFRIAPSFTVREMFGVTQPSGGRLRSQKTEPTAEVRSRSLRLRSDARSARFHLALSHLSPMVREMSGVKKTPRCGVFSPKR